MADKLKGNLVVAQSGGPTAVINASLAGVVQQGLKYDDTITGVYGALHGILGVLNEELLDFGKEKSEMVDLLRRTPSSALGSCRHKLSPEDYERILEVFQAHDIRYFFYIGGNDSMDTAHRVGQLAADAGYEMRCMGVPKTIDNDLGYTDHTPGYGSVARWIASSVRDAGLDTEAIGAVDKVKVIEIMGRNAGWITAASALARDHVDAAPHLIYLPERPISMEKVFEDVQKVYDRIGHCVIAICEGAKGPDGEPLSASGSAIDVDAFGHKQMGGVADFLCKQIAANLGLKARFDKPGTIQRMSAALASRVDQKEAYAVGQMAVRHAVDGVSDKMVTLVRESNDPYKWSTGLADLELVANAEKLIPDEFIAEDANDVTAAFLEYARPLIGGPLPKYAYLEKSLLPRKTGTTGKGEHVMAKRIKITAGDVTAYGELNDTNTAQKIWDALPIEARGNTWGDEIYCSIPVQLGEENAQAVVDMGDLAYWPPGNAFCIFFGRTPASHGDDIRPASPVNVFGKVGGDPKVFKKVQSGTSVVLEKADE